MSLTDQLPLSVRDEIRGVAGVVFVQLKVDATRVVRPRTELHTAQLIVEREPAYVDLTRAEEHAGRYPQAAAVRRYHHVRRKCAVDVFVGTDNNNDNIKITIT